MREQHSRPRLQCPTQSPCPCAPPPRLCRTLRLVHRFVASCSWFQVSDLTFEGKAKRVEELVVERVEEGVEEGALPSSAELLCILRRADGFRAGAPQVRLSGASVARLKGRELTGGGRSLRTESRDHLQGGGAAPSDGGLTAFAKTKKTCCCETQLKAESRRKRSGLFRPQTSKHASKHAKATRS